MHEQFFIAFLNMSLSASFVIAAVLLLRLLLLRAPKMISYALWAVVLIRLVCPFTIPVSVDILPSSTPIPSDIAMQTTPQIDSGIGLVDSAVNAILPPASYAASANPLQIWLAVGELFWLVGAALMLLYGILSMFLLRRRVGNARVFRDNIYMSGRIDTPFVLGILRPRIYLPEGLSEDEIALILPHEQTHIRRGDHIIKLISFFVLCIHWFNPMVWLAFHLMSRDMELSCDEAVLRRMDDAFRRDYARVLLALASGQRVGISPAFGEVGVKSRIKRAVSYRKTALGIVIIAVILAAAAGILLLMAPLGDTVEQIEFPARAYTEEPINPLTPFTLEIDLPDQWELRDGGLCSAVTGLHTPLDIYVNDLFIGTIACGSYAPYDTELYGEISADHFYQYVYTTLRLNRMYNWNIGEAVTITETSRTHLAEVWTVMNPGDGSSMAAWPTVETAGILCYEDTKHVYIAIEFEDGAVTPEVQREIAESIRIK